MHMLVIFLHGCVGFLFLVVIVFSLWVVCTSQKMVGTIISE